MKKLILLILFCNAIIVTGQTIKTHASQYFYYYPDSTKNIEGFCGFNVDIGHDTIKLALEPELVLVVSERWLPENFMDGDLLTMTANDNQGGRCTIRLVITPTWKELHLIYSDTEWGYILKD